MQKNSKGVNNNKYNYETNKNNAIRTNYIKEKTDNNQRRVSVGYVETEKKHVVFWLVTTSSNNNKTNHDIWGK